MFVCVFFSLPLIFTLVAAGISHFLTPTTKFSCFSSKKICLLCFSSLALALSVIHVSVDIKIELKKDLALLLLLLSKSQGGHVIFSRPLN